MILLTLVSWWYDRGWKGQAARAKRRTMRTAEYFSLGLLARTLFDPFRQIDAGVPQGGNVNVQMHALFDRTFSRVIGFVIRSFSIFIGLGAVGFSVVVGGLQVVFWPLVPVFPLIGLVLFASGWMA
jgi:hypothetical protein